MRYLVVILFCCLSFSKVQAQIPDAIYEIRYWQDMTQMGNTPLLIDTMIYFGNNDRAGFDYTNAECVSYHCRDTDSILYSLLPKIMGLETEWTLGDYFVRKLSSHFFKFRGKEREFFKVYASDINNKNSGIGDYSMLSLEFGVICRWNSDGEFYQLNRIDVYKNDQIRDEIDLVPLLGNIYNSAAFRP